MSTPTTHPAVDLHPRAPGRWGAFAQLLLGAALLLGSACGGTAPPSQPDGGFSSAELCPPGLSECNEICVNTALDPDNCGACGVVCGAGEVCSRGSCQINCGAGLSDCGGVCVNVSNDPDNCGACATACTGEEVCSAGSCVITCAEGQENCGGSCVDLQSEPSHCGACGVVCEPGQDCRGGQCEVSCPAGFQACGGVCTNPLSDPDNCGLCGTRCDAGTVCLKGSCEVVCPSGFQACGGACTNPLTDPDNCGLCGTRCEAGAVCLQGSCEVVCPAGQVVCGGQCVTPRTDPAHCGGCDQACAPGELCAEGACATVCPAGFTDCAGACVNTGNDPGACGACDTACAPGEVCSAGTCGVVCPAGQENCGGACVNTSNDAAHCGACAAACAPGEVCSGGACAVVCPAGQTNCGGSCVTLRTDVAHCGACGVACGAGELCVDGACSVVCPAGQTNCAGKCVTLENDSAHCGACGKTCAAGEVCSGGACTVTCPSGQATCGGDCTLTSFDPANCGSCGNACASAELCASGACYPVCGVGESLCPAGCADLEGDAANCGACGSACAEGEVCRAGGCFGAPNGYAAVDPWGEVWDGVARGNATWAVAKAKCEALGGRLPTATELYRNNPSSGTGVLGDLTDTNWYWTRLTEYRTNYYIVARANDGAMSNSIGSTVRPYRCVWPDASPAAFTAEVCHGAPGSTCQATGLWFNADTEDRPALPYASAASECEFYNASLPGIQDFSRLVKAGWTKPSNTWLWMAETKYWYAGNYGLALGRWAKDPQPEWGYDPGTDGSLAGPTSYHRFRCVGKRSASEGKLAASPSCQTGSCFTLSKGARARLIADNVDRPAATYPAALETCRGLGAALPTTQEVTDLIHGGWANGSNNWNWTSEPVYWYANAYGYAILKWTGAGNALWDVRPGTMGVIPKTSSIPYRCVWRETFEDQGASMTTCGAGEDQLWSGAAFSCKAAVDGDSAGKAISQFMDAWGNAWDGQDRGASNYATAKGICANLGARLPSASELWRVRVNNALVAPLPNASTAWLWSHAPEYRVNYRSLLRASDGAYTAVPETSAVAFRCIWPSSKGDVMGGRSCYGPANDPCYQSGRLRMDRYDRAALTAPAAAWECDQVGGRLPTESDLARLIHSGAPNGSNAWLWMNRPIYWYNGGYGYALGRWSGVGPATWGYDAGTQGTLSYEYNPNRFRCVFTDELR